MVLAYTFLAEKEFKNEFGWEVRIEKLAMDYSWSIKHTGNYININRENNDG